MYNIFYIYTINTQDRQTRSRSHALNTHTSQHRIDSLISYTHSQEQTASYLYMGKIHKPHNAPSHIIGNLYICGDSEKLHNAFYVSILSLFVTTLKTFCNLFVICRAKWARVCVGKLKIDVIRAHIRPKALAL